jgi:hypothetical protein
LERPQIFLKDFWIPTLIRNTFGYRDEPDGQNGFVAGRQEPDPSVGDAVLTSKRCIDGCVSITVGVSSIAPRFPVPDQLDLGIVLEPPFPIGAGTVQPGRPVVVDDPQSRFEPAAILLLGAKGYDLSTDLDEGKVPGHRRSGGHQDSKDDDCKTGHLHSGTIVCASLESGLGFSMQYAGFSPDDQRFRSCAGKLHRPAACQCRRRWNMVGVRVRMEPTMIIDRAPRLASLTGCRLGFLDCGKRGGVEILRAVAESIAAGGAVVTHESKTSAHRMASRRLVEKLSSEYDGIVYGVVD